MKNRFAIQFALAGFMLGVLFILHFAGCNTIEGLGEDLAAGARATREFVFPPKAKRQPVARPTNEEDTNFRLVEPGRNEELLDGDNPDDTPTAPAKSKRLKMVNPGRSDN